MAMCWLPAKSPLRSDTCFWYPLTTQWVGTTGGVRLGHSEILTNPKSNGNQKCRPKLSKIFWPKTIPIFVITHHIYKMFLHARCSPTFTDVQREAHIAVLYTDFCYINP